MAMKAKDITGQKFNKLTAIKYSHKKNGYDCWLFQCDCGKEKVINKYSVSGGQTRSCGCLYKNNNNKYKFCKTKEKLYGIWRGIKTRCYNKNIKYYYRYGGRGIIVCDKWLNDYLSFREWALENGYKENKGKNILTIDRINNNGNYEPNNCRWVTIKEQSRNRSGGK